MTDNEIIKVLEWLIFNFPKVEKPENDSDRLCNCINLYCKNAVDELKRQKAEIVRLNAVSEICGECHKKYAEKIEQAKSEAIKEFAERLKSLQIGLEISGESLYYVPIDCIDNLIKEMDKQRKEDEGK